MAEETTTTGTGDIGRQPEEGPSGSTATQTGPEGVEGQSGAAPATETTDTGTQQTTEDTFFDPQSIADKPELMSAYKQMQRAFGKKNEEFKAGREKIAAFDAFNTDPVGTLQNYAKQFGYNLTRAEAAAVADQTQNAEPQTWDEVYDRGAKAAEERIMERLAPMLGQLQDLKKGTLERTLDDAAPDWRQYEDQMTTNLRDHPTLANDPVTLYRLSVPPEVLESRATQAALAKLKEKGQSAQTSGASTTRQTTASGEPDGPLSFNDAVKFARDKLAADGITPGM